METQTDTSIAIIGHQTYLHQAYPNRPQGRSFTFRNQDSQETWTFFAPYRAGTTVLDMHELTVMLPPDSAWLPPNEGPWGTYDNYGWAAHGAARVEWKEVVNAIQDYQTTLISTARTETPPRNAFAPLIMERFETKDQAGFFYTLAFEDGKQGLAFLPGLDGVKDYDRLFAFPRPQPASVFKMTATEVMATEKFFPTETPPQELVAAVKAYETMRYLINGLEGGPKPWTAKATQHLAREPTLALT